MHDRQAIHLDAAKHDQSTPEVSHNPENRVFVASRNVHQPCLLPIVYAILFNTMAKAIEEHHFDTYARLIFSDWQALTTVLIDHVSSCKVQPTELENEQPPATGVKLLDEQQINDALDGPLGTFFRNMLATYVVYLRVATEKNIIDNDVFKGKRHNAEGEFKIPNDDVKRVSEDDVKDIKKQLNNLAKTSGEAWQENYAQWCEDTIQALDAAGIQLSEIEKTEFLSEEPISELLERFVELNIDQPKLKKGEMNYANYIKLKTDLAVLSSLSRQHMSHTQADIDKVLKKVKKQFDHIAKQEKQLHHDQQKAAEDAIQKITFAKQRF